MTALKIYKNGNYLIIEDVDNDKFIEDLLVNVKVSKEGLTSTEYFIYLLSTKSTVIAEYPYITDKNGTSYGSQTAWETFIFGCTGNANCTTSGGGGGGATDLSYVASPTDGVVTSSTGTDATITVVDSTNAGLMLPADKTKLDGIVSGVASVLKHNVKYGVALTKGQAVYVSSADGTNMIVSKADNSSEATSSKTLGLVTATGALNYQGEVITEGLLDGLDTSTATIGDAVWLGTNGNLIFWHYGLTTKPVAPAHLVFIGIVTRVNANNGEIFVKVQNGFELEELHNVLIQTLVDKNILYYDNATSLWKNGSITSVLGYTPEDSSNKSTSIVTDQSSNTKYPTVKSVYDWATGVFTTTSAVATQISTALTGYATQAWVTSQGYITNVISSLGYTPANKTGDTFTGDIFAQNLSGNNTGDETTVSIKTKLGQSSSTFDGWLSSVDWNTFNNKQNALSGGTTNRLVKWTSASAIGNSQIADDGVSLAIGASLNASVQLGIATTKAYGFQSRGATYGVYGTVTTSGYGVYGKTTGGVGVFGISDATSSLNNIGVEGQAINASPLNIGGKFTGSGGTANYSVQLIDGTETVIGRFLKNTTTDGKANWVTLSVADTGLTLTTTGSTGVATLVGNTLNIPNYSSGGSNDLFKFGANEFFRGITINNNSTTVTTEGGVTMSTSASTLAQSVATTAFNLKNIRLRYYASVVSTGRYTGTRGSALLWYVGGGFRYICSFAVSDSAYNSGCRQFFGMAGSTADLTYTDTILVSSLQNIIGIGSDALDANLQVFTNDTTGTATKIDLGANFPANRTSGSAMTTIYQVQIYNPSGSSNVYYRVINLETGNSAEGTLTSDLPAQTQGLNFFASRCMGTPLTNSGEFYLYNQFGVYSVA